MVWKDNKPIVFVSLGCPPVGPHRMDAVTDDRFQIASSAEAKRSTGRLRWPVGVSGITIPAKVWPVLCLWRSWEKRERRLFTRGRTSPPAPSSCSPVFVKRKSTRSPDIPLPLTLLQTYCLNTVVVASVWVEWMWFSTWKLLEGKVHCSLLLCFPVCV